MPVKLQFYLEGPDARSLRDFRPAAHLRGRAIEWLEAAEAGRGLEERTAQRTRSFSLGPLEPGPAPRRWRVDLSLLREELADLFVAGARARPVVQLGGEPFRFVGYLETKRDTWEALAAPAPGWRGVRLELRTPTAHSQGGEWDKDIVVPTPERYFGTWLDRWNLNAPTRVEDADRVLELARERVVVGAMRGETAEACLDPGRPQLGFVGEVLFLVLESRRMTRAEREAAEAGGARGRRVHEPLGQRDRDLLARLARLSAYCGTGIETQRGMGVTVPL